MLRQYRQQTPRARKTQHQKRLSRTQSLSIHHPIQMQTRQSCLLRLRCLPRSILVMLKAHSHLAIFQQKTRHISLLQISIRLALPQKSPLMPVWSRRVLQPRKHSVNHPMMIQWRIHPVYYILLQNLFPSSQQAISSSRRNWSLRRDNGNSTAAFSRGSPHGFQSHFQAL